MEQRIVELEKRAAFQDHLLEELNEVILDQQKRIEILERQLKIFSDQFHSGEWIRRREEEEPPPHY